MTAIYRFLAVAALSALLASCGGKKSVSSADITTPPDSLISAGNMVHILVDVHILEAALVIQRNEGSAEMEKPDGLYKGLFAKYHISKARYDASLKYYQQNPHLMKKIYEKVIPELENKEKIFLKGNRVTR